MPQNKYTIQNKHKSHRKPIIIGCLLLVFIVVIAGSLFYRSQSSSNTEPAATPKPTQPVTNLDPPTPQDKQEVDQNKQQIVDRQDQPTPPPSSSNKKTVTPIIVDAGQYGQEIEIRGYVPNIYESDGTCTITIIKGSQTITKQSSGVKDATTTRCNNITVNRSELSSSGTWNAVINYNSSNAQGSSGSKSFEVQ